MILNLLPGIENEMQREVGPDDIATSFGSEHMPVLATSKIVAFMEYVALESVNKLLPDGFSTVGTEINMKHISPVLPGQTVSCHSRLVKLNGRKLYFEISMRTRTGAVAKASHVRTVISEEAFKRMLGLDKTE